MRRGQLSALAVVTGAASGIGRAVALALAAEGRAVALVDVDGDGVARTGVECEQRGAAGIVLSVADVADEAAMARAIGDAVSRFGPPVATFANAGIERCAPAHEMSQELWDAVLATNLTGVFLTVKHALAAMRAADTPGAVVCTSSPSAFVGFAGGGNAAYGASKGGIVSFVKSVAIDYARFGIRINAVVPGAIDTPKVGATSGDGLASIAERAAAVIPLGRLGRPDEIADAVIWLLSERASYVTGAAIVCDGGLTARSVNDF